MVKNHSNRVFVIFPPKFEIRLFRATFRNIPRNLRMGISLLNRKMSSIAETMEDISLSCLTVPHNDRLITREKEFAFYRLNPQAYNYSKKYACPRVKDVERS